MPGSVHIGAMFFSRENIMLSIFSIPKPFLGHLEIIQKNAVESWRRIHPECEVFLFGDEPGVEKAAEELKVKHVPDIMKNEFGTPLLNQVFASACKMASHRLICYVNTDIILFKSIIRALDHLHFDPFLMTGRRWELDVRERLDFTVADWDIHLSRLALEKGNQGSPDALDYFFFPRDSGLIEIPAFVVGRPGWDNWFIFRARQLRIPVIDATHFVQIIHQNHDYTHVPAQRGKQWEGPEADWNRNLIGDQNRIFTLLDATHIFKGIHIKTALSLNYVRRRWQTITILFPKLIPFIKILSKILNFFKSLHIIKMKRN